MNFLDMLNCLLEWNEKLYLGYWVIIPPPPPSMAFIYAEGHRGITSKFYVIVYFPNHSLDSIPIWAIGTLEGRPGVGLEVKI